MNYFYDGARNNERSSAAASSSSSRKGKKSNSDKPKQPQRGLGVAQLEKIRLHSQLAFHQTSLHSQEGIKIQPAYPPSSSFTNTSSSTTYNASQGQQSFMNLHMGMGEQDRLNMIHGQSQPSIDPRWNANSDLLEAQYYAQHRTTRLLFQVEVEDSLRKKKMSDSTVSSNDSYSLNDSQELDLELKLSL
ncbi:protein SPEAR3-like [Rutidosis leptorrhynchoides]|uniref:protein SPEAR3-like n=1 Tax=Rutidosis leptorrhynchoides TaxID=125765 RepID=UPI003A992761